MAGRDSLHAGLPAFEAATGGKRYLRYISPAAQRNTTCFDFFKKQMLVPPGFILALVPTWSIALHKEQHCWLRDVTRLGLLSLVRRAPTSDGRRHTCKLDTGLPRFDAITAIFRIAHSLQGLLKAKGETLTPRSLCT
jgi:hypothetical protein